MKTTTKSKECMSIAEGHSYLTRFFEKLKSLCVHFATCESIVKRILPKTSHGIIRSFPFNIVCLWYDP